jgi:NADPH2:quinone reductase
MHALICDDFSGIESLRVGELPEPRPTPGSLLIQVEASAVNFADTLMVSGQYQHRPELPFAPGYEVAGTVVVANQTPGFAPGDRVCGFHTHGAMAERAVLLASNSAVLPDSIPSDVGAVLPAGYGTSYHALIDRGKLQEEETLLVLGAAGGVGLAAVQIGKAIGSKVIAAVSSAEKAAFVSANGADHVIRYDQTSLRDGINSVTEGAGVDVVFDPVGGTATETALRSTSWNGRLLVVGFAAGDIPSIPLNLPLLKGNSITGVFWGRFTTEQPERHRENLERILDWTTDGTLQPAIQKQFTLDDAPAALRWVADRKAMGRVVIVP